MVIFWTHSHNSPFQTGQRPRFIFENSSFADWSEAGLEDREGEGGGGGDHSQREEKQAAQLKS